MLMVYKSRIFNSSVVPCDHGAASYEKKDAHRLNSLSGQFIQHQLSRNVHYLGRKHVRVNTQTVKQVRVNTQKVNHIRVNKNAQTINL